MFGPAVGNVTQAANLTYNTTYHYGCEAAPPDPQWMFWLMLLTFVATLMGAYYAYIQTGLMKKELTQNGQPYSSKMETDFKTGK